MSPHRLFPYDKINVKELFVYCEAFSLYNMQVPCSPNKTLAYQFLSSVILGKLYFGRWNTLVISCICSMLIPSGANPIFFPAIYICALLVSTST